VKKSISIISIFINVLLITGIVIFYLKLNAQPKSNPYKLFSERRISFFSSFVVNPESIVFLGDSLTDEGRWTEIFPDLVILNRGIGADRTNDVQMRIHQITKGQPKLVFLMVGTNDLNMNVAQETIVSNYRRILQSIKNEAPKSKIFIQSILPRQSTFQNRIERLNQKLLTLAQDFDYTFIDLYPAFLNNDGSIKNEYSNDELHLLGAGYKKWKELIEPYLLPYY
jgi:hexosaminidase